MRLFALIDLSFDLTSSLTKVDLFNLEFDFDLKEFVLILTLDEAAVLAAVLFFGLSYLICVSLSDS